MRFLLVCALSGCVIDSKLKPDAAPDPFDSGVQDSDTARPDTGDTSPPPPSEECNGVDDNGDGVVDEGYPDYDGDGVADCMDSSCVVDSTPAGVEDQDPECVTEWLPPADPSNFVVQWATAGGEQYSPPVVARTTDSDGDGDIDANDIPDIYSVEIGGALWRFAGDGSSARVVASDVKIGSVTFADVDGDGTANLLIGRSSTLDLCALELDMSELWCSSGARVNGGGSPMVADLDHDGDVEVIGLGGILDGATGTVQTVLPSLGFNGQPVLGDIDADGYDEILVGPRLLRSDGTVIFDYSTADDIAFSTFIDRDADGVPEVLSLDMLASRLRIYDVDGTQLAEVALDPWRVASPPCVADLDGDGLPEIGVPDMSELYVFDGDLAEVWSVSIRDSSDAASCSAFDFDADGAFELVYADEQDLHVYRGDGTDMLVWADHSSGTSLEYPTIADVDLDGSADIVVAQAYMSSGIAVLSHASGGWAPADPLWADNGATGGMVDVAGTVNPARPSPFRGGGRYHVQEAGTWDAASGTWILRDALPDLAVDIEDVCAVDCTDGPWQVGVSVTNRGVVDADAVVVLYANDGAEVEVGRVLVSLPAGSRGEPLLFTADAEPAFGWHATIEAATQPRDCDPSDNEDRWDDRTCP